MKSSNVPPNVPGSMPLHRCSPGDHVTLLVASSQFQCPFGRLQHEPSEHSRPDGVLVRGLA